jgi:hypothetical protein
MKRRDFVSGLVAAAILSGPVLAQDYVASVISQLERMGFRIVRQERTLLGRVRIVGTRGDGRREIIINPNSGEILRDFWSPTSGGNSTSTIIDDKSRNSGSGSGGDDDDDDDDDHGGSDNSGSGSSNSGSGGGDDDDDDDSSGGGDDDGGDDDDDD